MRYIIAILLLCILAVITQCSPIVTAATSHQVEEYGLNDRFGEGFRRYGGNNDDIGINANIRLGPVNRVLNTFGIVD
ncbi:unnamed protein product [Strongylus vulgaris]|uniref:Uncharacterized protein n=1 Tax=Strongylus vulgaris TaxID=40348 RepID=A0A3P7JC07_STRVU|nr:unnamed protein product [Strongylus vulgaris]